MPTNAERFRLLVGEPIPENGQDSDTMFLDEQINELIQENGSVEAAVAVGWRIKAANFADLVDTSEGTSKRAMSDLHKNALAMAASYFTSSGTGGGRTRSRPIVRT